VVAERRGDGSVLLRSPVPLGSWPASLTERLEHWAARDPQRILFAQRDGAGWKTLSYAQALERGRRIAAGLL
jgi:feruloyl-CoA synthase